MSDVDPALGPVATMPAIPQKRFVTMLRFHEAGTNQHVGSVKLLESGETAADFRSPKLAATLSLKVFDRLGDSISTILSGDGAGERLERLCAEALGGAYVIHRLTMESYDGVAVGDGEDGPVDVDTALQEFQAREAWGSADDYDQQGVAPWAPLPEKAARELIASTPTAQIEVNFPTVYEEDRTKKVQDLVTAEAVQAITHQRMSEQVAKELGFEQYDYATEQAQIKADPGPTVAGALGAGTPQGAQAMIQQMTGAPMTAGGPAGGWKAAANPAHAMLKPAQAHVPGTPPSHRGAPAQAELKGKGGMDVHRPGMDATSRAEYRNQQRTRMAESLFLEDDGESPFLRVVEAEVVAPVAEAQGADGQARADTLVRTVEALVGPLTEQNEQAWRTLRTIVEAWDPAAHPRHPAGTSDSMGGKFATKGTHAMPGGGEPSPTPQAPPRDIERPSYSLVETPEGTFGRPEPDPRLFKTLGGNLYSGDLGQIAAKELLQNAVDATRKMGSRGKIGLAIDTNARTITISDNGSGMPKSVLGKEFINPGGSVKDEGASGGYGLAKIAIFVNSTKVDVDSTTESREEPGKLVRHVMSFSGDDWTARKDLGIKEEPVPKDGETGTKITVHLKDDVKMTEGKAYQYLKQFSALQRLPFQFTMSVNGDTIPQGEGDPGSSYGSDSHVKAEDKKVITTIDAPGASITLYSDPDRQQETSGPSVAVLNNGLPQFDTYIPIRGEGVKIPGGLVADVRATGKPDEPNYPFRPDRQGLREDAEQAIKKYINDNLVSEAVKNESETLARKIASAPKIARTKGNLRVVDSADSLPDAFVQTVSQRPYATELGRDLRKGFDDLQEMLVKRDSSYGDAALAGLGLGREYYGVNVPGKAVGGDKNLIFVNPLMHAETAKEAIERGMIQESEGPEFIAKQMVATLVHELAHQEARNHYESFSSALTRAYGDTAILGASIAKHITNTLKENDRALYSQLIADAKEYADVYGSERSGTDVFGKVGHIYATRYAPGQHPGRESSPDDGRGGASRLSEALPLRGGAPSEDLAERAALPEIVAREVARVLGTMRKTKRVLYDDAGRFAGMVEDVG